MVILLSTRFLRSHRQFVSGKKRHLFTQNLLAVPSQMSHLVFWKTKPLLPCSELELRAPCHSLLWVRKSFARLRHHNRWVGSPIVPLSNEVSYFYLSRLLTPGLFATRDTMTILASFTLPGIISLKMQEGGHSKDTSDVFSQLFTPVSMQILSTPLHLHGLDLYNREVATNSDRIKFVGQEYVKTTLARMARIFPAFGVGGVINKYVRKTGNEMLRRHYHAPVWCLLHTITFRSCVTVSYSKLNRHHSWFWFPFPKFSYDTRRLIFRYRSEKKDRKVIQSIAVH